MPHRIQRVNVVVREFRLRDDIKNEWVKPRRDEDSLQYGASESGEAIDADTKSRFPEHLRRVRQGHTVADELGMTAIMFLTALDEDELEIDQRWEPPHDYGQNGDLLHEINYRVALAYRLGRNSQPWRDEAKAALWLISMQLGHELLPCVEANLQRIERRVTERAERLAK